MNKNVRMVFFVLGLGSVFGLALLLTPIIFAPKATPTTTVQCQTNGQCQGGGNGVCYEGTCITSPTIRPVLPTASELTFTPPPSWVKSVGIYTYTVTMERSSKPELAGVKLIFGESNGFYLNHAAMDFWTRAYVNEAGTRLHFPIYLDNPSIGTVYVILYKLMNETCLATPAISIVGRQINNNTGEVLSYIAQITDLDQDNQYLPWTKFCPLASDPFWQPPQWVPAVEPNA